MTDSYVPIGERSALIEKAFKTKPSYEASHEADEYIAQAARTLANFKMPSSRFPNAFKNAGRSAVEKELLQFCSFARKTEEIFKNFHEPTINKLADVGVIRSNVENLLTPLIELAQVVSKIDVSDVPTTIPRGRHKQYITAIVHTIYYYYELAYGKPPKISVNPISNLDSSDYIDLIAEIANILGVREEEFSAAAQARSAIKRLRRNGSQKKSQTYF